MQKSMNELETAILEEIANSNPELNANLKAHYSVLRIIGRKYTGVGIFVNFKYENLELTPISANHLGGNAELLIPKLEFPVTYEIAITNGMIDFIELVSNGGDWNGEFDGFKLVE
tara:strand:+ start:201 stop:545 length:345 start_codon:yes stop_codon:yes gene_type:complete